MKNCAAKSLSWCGLIVSFSLILTACTPAPDAQWQDYRERLSRVLSSELLAPVPQAPMALPSVKTAPELHSDQITLIDLARLHECGLDGLVSERNSSLGKMMPAAVALGYELKLLDLLPSCIALPDLPSDLRNQLISIRLQKLAALPSRFTMLLTTDPTLRSQLQGSKRGITDMAGQTQTRQALQSLYETAKALQQLSANAAVSKNFEVAETISASETAKTRPAATTSSVAEQAVRPTAALLQQPWMAALSAIHQSQRLADLQHSARQSVLELSSLNDALERLVLTCPSGQRQVMDQVLQQIFIGRLQPLLAETDQSLTELNPWLVQLYATAPWRDLVEQRFVAPQQQLQQQLRRHVRWWQAYQQRCPR